MRRGLFKSMGYSDYDLDRPLIGIANSWNTVVSGHYNLKQVAQSVRRGIDQAGGTPVEFGVIGGCDGLADGGKSARYMLPSRTLIADSVEMMVEAHHLDGVVLLGSCDKIVPGMLMAAARLDLPSVLIVGGPSPGGCRFDGRFSGSNNGCFVGHISPEAALGGPIALVRDKDTITIDIPNGTLTLHVSEKELQARREKWQPPEPKPEIQGYLNVYGRLARSASKGAIVTHRGESFND